MKVKRGASGDRSPVGDQELVLPYPALNIRFGVSFVIVSFVSVVLTVAAEIPVALAISEAVIGPRPFSAARILALF